MLKLYAKVKNRLGERSAIGSFEEHQAYSAKVRETLQWLLLPLHPTATTTTTTTAAAPVGLVLQGVAAPHVPSEWLPKDQHYISVREWFGLQSAARWWNKGVQYRQLLHAIHPHPGCYFAVPTSRWVSFHFEVFQEWIDSTASLQQVHKVVEVGTGCGVLSFMLLQAAAGPIEVTAVDVNPAAVMTVTDNAHRLNLHPTNAGVGGSNESDGGEGDAAGVGGKQTVTAELSNLIPTRFKQELDLVVFNPPWFPVEDDETNTPSGVAAAAAATGAPAPAPGTAGRLAAAAAAAINGISDEVSRGGGVGAHGRGEGGLPTNSANDWLDQASPYLRAVLDGEHWLEAASYRDQNLMERFFDSAHAALKVGGRVVVIYCNYAQLVGKEERPGPVPLELVTSGRFKQQTLLRRAVPLSRKAQEGKEHGWKTELLKELEIEVWVLEKTAE
jgi:methylase of polypeptide subunit release factors